MINIAFCRIPRFFFSMNVMLVEENAYDALDVHANFSPKKKVLTVLSININSNVDCFLFSPSSINENKYFYPFIKECLRKFIIEHFHFHCLTVLVCDMLLLPS